MSEYDLMVAALVVCLLALLVFVVLPWSWHNTVCRRRRQRKFELASAGEAGFWHGLFLEQGEWRAKSVARVATWYSIRNWEYAQLRCRRCREETASFSTLNLAQFLEGIGKVTVDELWQILAQFTPFGPKGESSMMTRMRMTMRCAIGMEIANRYMVIGTERVFTDEEFCNLFTLVMDDEMAFDPTRHDYLVETVGVVRYSMAAIFRTYCKGWLWDKARAESTPPRFRALALRLLSEIYEDLANTKTRSAEEVLATRSV